MLKNTTQQEDITILNVCTANNTASKYIKQKLTSLIGEINKATIIFGDFNSSLL